ncbi:MAG TPA: hypothetical protein VF006_09065 [Longimicrobium sp.]
MQDYRSIPVEVLRDFARTRAEMTSIRKAADEVGIGRSTFHKLIQGRTTPLPRVRRQLGLWYLQMQNEAPDVDVVRPYAAALVVLLSGIQADQQKAARAELVASLRDLYASRTPVPRWLELLLKS